MQHRLVVIAGVGLSDKQDIVVVRTKPVINLLVDIFVGHDLHVRTYSIG